VNPPWVEPGVWRPEMWALLDSSDVEFLIEVPTRECVHHIGKMCTSEYPYGKGERRLVINTKESACRW
jgi:hypothetical protein